MANLTNSAKLIAEMEKKANLTDLPDVYDSTVTVVVNGNTGSNTFSTNQPSNSTLKVTVGKSDVGLGNVDNTSDANKPISTATQAALDLKADKSDISSVYKYKGSVANYESLPSSGQTVGDVYNVEAAHTTAPKFDAGANVAWNGTAWDVLGGNVDLSNYPTNSDVLTKTNTTSFTPSGDYQPATKKYVDDSVSAIEPSNTKTFFLPGVGASQSVLTVAQAAWDRYKAGKDPIIIYDNKAYTVFSYQSTGQTTLTFASSGVGNKDGNSDSNRIFALIRITASSDVVNYVSSANNDTPGKYLRTDYNYSTPYTPTYNGSPATKKYVDDTVASAKSSGATAPSNPTEGQLWYDTTNDVLKVYDGTNWNVTGKEYTAGAGIEINNNSISAKAGTGIAVGDGSPDYSAMRGPCPNGYHIPLHTEHQDLVNMWTALGFGTSSGIDFVTYFHTPTSCSRWSNGNNQGFSGVAISWSANKAPDGFYVLSAYADPAYPSENYVETNYMLGLYESFGHPIRAFKDVPVIPDNNWTTVYQGTGSAGIYHNSTLGLISISSDGTNWITLKDKNEGATTVWNYGDTLSAANVGNVYQRGNNYGFPRTGTITTSNTQVDASNYGPGNYYSSSTFITSGNNPWDSSGNRNLRGGVTGIVHPNGITNTGVLSVNGQTGNVTIASPDMSNYLAKNNTTAYTPTANYHPATKKYVDDNIKIYNAGTGISISNIIKNGRQGPAPDGFHVPASSERESVKSILVTTFGLTSSSSTLQDYLKMPAAGERNYTDSSVKNQGTIGQYRSTTPNGNQVAFKMNFGSDYFYPKNNNSTGYACSIRCFKDTAISPDSRWEILYDGSSIATGAGVFYNSLLGLISLSGDGITWITIQDKNLGATTVYNNGDILSEANCGKYYQWGNNYGFPRASDATITTSSTKVNASNYGPGNYYSSDTFIIKNAWDSSNNQDLWGNTTSTFTVKNGITNTGVLSVNGQTGDVTIQGGGGHDYSWETATISSGAVTLGLRTVVEPTSNFTLNAPSNLEDGMEYVLRCVNGSTAYTLTLGTGFVNDFSTDLTLHANHSDQFTFVAYDGTLELQPDYATKDYVDDMIGNIETLLSNI